MRGGVVVDVAARQVDQHADHPRTLRRSVTLIVLPSGFFPGHRRFANACVITVTAGRPFVSPLADHHVRIDELGWLQFAPIVCGRGPRRSSWRR